MSEIQTNNTSRKQRGVFKSKKQSTRVDLTPMVDLGFLLITFFIFTTALAKPAAMKMVMPDDTPVDIPAKTSEEKTLTLLVAKDNRLFYYPGIFKGGGVKEIDFKELRNVIINKKQQVFKKFGSSKIVILIKVTNEANFKNIVDALDEMTINAVSSFMLLEPDAKELEANGRIAKKICKDIITGVQKLDLNINDLSNGTYILNTFNGDVFLKSFKFIKQ